MRYYNQTVSVAVLAFPFAGKHAVDNVVDEVVAQPGIVAQDAFLRETESFGNDAAPRIASGYLYLNAVQPQLLESVIHHRAAGSRHQPFALCRGGQPVPDLCLVVFVIDKVKADDSHNLALIEDARVEAVVL